MAGNDILEIKGENFNHLKARRNIVSDRIEVRNLKDSYSYIYEIKKLERKAICELIFKSLLKVIESSLTLAWAVVEPNVIEKTLPGLNELGVKKTIFVYTEFSQKIFRLDLARFERILINSSEQCGRNGIMKIEVFKSIDKFLEIYKDIALIDFKGKNLSEVRENEILFIGAEGGFSDFEREKFINSYTLNSPNILRSNTAIIGVASKILL